MGYRVQILQCGVNLYYIYCIHYMRYYCKGF